MRRRSERIYAQGRGFFPLDRDFCQVYYEYRLPSIITLMLVNKYGKRRKNTTSLF